MQFDLWSVWQPLQHPVVPWPCLEPAPPHPALPCPEKPRLCLGPAWFDLLCIALLELFALVVQIVLSHSHTSHMCYVCSLQTMSTNIFSS